MKGDNKNHKDCEWKGGNKNIKMLSGRKSEMRILKIMKMLSEKFRERFLSSSSPQNVSTREVFPRSACSQPFNYRGHSIQIQSLL